MARIMTEHYESGSNTEQRLLIENGTNVRDSATYGLSGDGSRRWVQHNNSSGSAYRKLAMRANYSEVYLAMWGYQNALPSTTTFAQVFQFWKGDVDMAAFVLNASAQFAPRIGTTIQTYGNYVLSFGVWHCFECHYKISAGSGVLELKVDGIQACIFSGDTTYSGKTDFDILSHLWSATVDGRTDGLCVNDISGGSENSWIGINYCSSRDPNADSGTYNSWPHSSGGGKYLDVDEYPPNTSDYIYSVTNAQKQGFSFPSYNLPADAVPVAVIDEYYARKMSSGQIKQGQRYSGTDYQSSTKDLGVDWKTMQERRIVDPSGGAWNLTSVDGVETFVEAII